MTTYVIGRAADCDVRVDSEYASPRHARVFRDAGTWWVEDLGSTNGTYLRRGGRDFQVIGRQPLQLGDVIMVGRVSIPWQRSAVEPLRVTAEVGQRLDEGQPLESATNTDGGRP